jgi:CheY-like chemotaxis protein
MPGTHGLEAIERIRERNKEVPIIICSAYRLMEDDIVVKTSNVAAFITKPIDIKALQTKVWELIGD